MAVDLAQKRFSATMLLMPGFTPGVVPEDVSIDAALRQAVSWMYAGISAGLPVVGGATLNAVRLTLELRL